MIARRFSALAPAVLVIWCATARAQIVRGVASERASGDLVAGVLVVLEHAAPPSGIARAAGGALTNERGEYAVRAPAPGRYVITAKRIGVQRYRSEPFDLTAGETRRADIALDAVVYNLPTVVVSEAAFCVTRLDQLQRVAALWDEIRTALTATQLSLRDRLFQGQISRYVRELDPRSLRVLSESRAEMKGVLDRPFTSLSGDSLSKVGYWRQMSDGTALYSAPDADVLLSDAFQRDHCYGIAIGGRDRRGLAGLTFEPTLSRPVPEVRGTIWLDARTFELRLVEFRYTRIEPTPGSDRVGGEVHFARLKSGAWAVRRWFIRMPQYGRYAASPVGTEGRMPSVIIRPAVYRLLEEGGDVYAAGLRLFERPAAVAGVVVDSAGRPFGGVTVRVGNAPFSALADSAGRFRLDSLPAGRFTLIAEHPSYAALGSAVTDEEVELEEGATRQVTLRATGAAEIVERLCDGKPPQRRRATIRLTMLDSTTAAPLSSLGIWLRWPSPTAGDLGRTFGLRSMTDARGAVAFCDLPADTPLWIHVLHPSGTPTRITELRLRENEVAGATIRATRPR